MSEERGRPQGLPPGSGVSGERRRSDFWDSSDSGSRLVSRPIVVDGLKASSLQIELAPRIRWVAGQLVDDSFRAVDRMALQLVKAFTLEQLAMATVALQVNLRKQKAFIEKKRQLQDRWTALARRMRKLRAEETHLGFAEKRLSERREEMVRLAADDSDPKRLVEVEAILEIEEAEFLRRRREWAAEAHAARCEWTTLEEEDAKLLSGAPREESTGDLRYPYVLTLVAPRDGPRRRSLASAMHTLVDALQKPLSRTDQMLLEIAFRRCVREHVPRAEQSSPDAWERSLLRAAEDEFVAEFPWSRPYRQGSARPGPITTAVRALGVPRPEEPRA
ncbi:hypothetical protein FBQ97_06345 [Acidobacteria bacterium ACD]|nr:MAG: hypothetical protein EDX89_00515 [Acidobacteriota bacterium]MCE7957617.1 hypothetical protein [Acidobacteria bacterium ACB2]MDL1949420.1 hypothetical protein [Acidobacteria bacterium ACD]